MNTNNTLNFLLGAALGGIATYYALKHQDEIIDKIHELEENLNLDHNELIASAKHKLDQLTQNVQSTIGRFSPHEDKSEEVASIMEELERLRAEVAALKA
jgi:hypothetical protein